MCSARFPIGIPFSALFPALPHTFSLFMWVRGLPHSCAAPSSLLTSLPNDVEMAGKCDAQRWKEQSLGKTGERREQETDGEDSGKEGRSWELNTVFLLSFQQGCAETQEAENAVMEKQGNGKQHGGMREGFQDRWLSGHFHQHHHKWGKSRSGFVEIYFSNGVCTNNNCFQMASSCDEFCTVIIQFAFLLSAENSKQ